MIRVGSERIVAALPSGLVTPAAQDRVGEAGTTAASIRDEESGSSRRFWIKVAALTMVLLGLCALCAHASKQCLSGVWFAYQPGWEPYFARLEQPLLTASALTGGSALCDFWYRAPRRAALGALVSALMAALAFRAVGYAASGLFVALWFYVLDAYALLLKAWHTIELQKALPSAALSTPGSGSSGGTQGSPPVEMGAAGACSASTGAAVRASGAGSSSQGESAPGAAGSRALKEVKS